jgi:hypothetical protein
MGKHRTLRKSNFSKKGGAKKKYYKKSSNKKNHTKKIFFHSKKHRYHTIKKTHRGGSSGNYPAVYGIENRAVLYPISKYGIPAGPFDPPALSNGPNGNGPYPGVTYGISGGKRMHRKSKTKKVRRSKYHIGGGSQSTFLPQPLVNTSRSLTGGLTELVNGFGGYTNAASLNPYPYEQPIEHSNIL